MRIVSEFLLMKKEKLFALLASDKVNAVNCEKCCNLVTNVIISSYNVIVKDMWSGYTMRHATGK